MDWAIKRRIIALVIVLILIALPIAYKIYTVRSAQIPTCIDGKLNGDESGVDCGGSCQRMCVDNVLPLVTVWTRAVPVAGNVYHIASLVENQNRVASPDVKYTFSIYDSKNILIAERRGRTYIPANQSVVISAFGIPVGNRVPAFAFIKFEPIESWVRVDDRTTKQIIKTGELVWTDFSAGSRLTANITNTESVEISDITVTAVAYDAAGTAIAVSSTTVDSMLPAQTKPINFTWPTVVRPVRTQLVITINPFTQDSIPVIQNPLRHS